MPEIEKRIGEARAEGDLRENAEYHGARESQGMLQAKINLLRDKLNRASIIEPGTLPKDEVGFWNDRCPKRSGSRRRRKNTPWLAPGKEDYISGKILVSSPFAQALNGKKKGGKGRDPHSQGRIELRDSRNSSRRRRGITSSNPFCRQDKIPGRSESSILSFRGQAGFFLCAGGEMEGRTFFLAGFFVYCLICVYGRRCLMR